MKRIFPAGMFGLFVTLAAANTSVAQAPGCGYGCTAVLPFADGSQNMGYGLFTNRLFGHIHHHGPLFNYGPYSGYYPFEPYGPWTAQLQYTGPRPGDIGYGWNGFGFGHRFGYGCGTCGRFIGRGHGCENCSWGNYARGTLRNVFHRTHPRCYRAQCADCGGL